MKHVEPTAALDAYGRRERAAAWDEGTAHGIQCVDNNGEVDEGYRQPNPYRKGGT
jgi:hypothetical protein